MVHSSNLSEIEPAVRVPFDSFLGEQVPGLRTREPGNERFVDGNVVGGFGLVVVDHDNHEDAVAVDARQNFQVHGKFIAAQHRNRAGHARLLRCVGEHFDVRAT